MKIYLVSSICLVLGFCIGYIKASDDVLIDCRNSGYVKVFDKNISCSK